MKAAFAAVLVIFGVSSARAEPWQTEAFEENGVVVGSTAYQWVEGDAEVLLGYECDALLGLESLYVQTEDRWDETAGYAPDVPTTFTVDGTPYPLTGIYQNRDGYVFTFYDGIDGGFYELFDSLRAATGTITIAFYDKSYSFSAEGSGVAMSDAAASCF